MVLPGGRAAYLESQVPEGSAQSGAAGISCRLPDRRCPRTRWPAAPMRQSRCCADGVPYGCPAKVSRLEAPGVANRGRMRGWRNPYRYYQLDIK
jgi:hypothetical protein